MKISFCLPAFLCITLMAKAQQNQTPLPQTKNGFVVISHRGNHVHVPENTVASIKEAIKAGADYAEIDLRTTKDGYLVVSHDATVDRMTNGKGNVKDLTLDEIKKLKVINPDKSDTKTYRMPEFSEILKACKKDINIYLDFKDADVEETYRQLKAAGMEKQVVVYLNKESQYPQWRKKAPDMPLMTSIPETITTKEQLGLFLGQIQLKVVDNIYDSAMVAEALKKGVSVWLDVEGPDENPAVWNKAMSKGIQGMQTDHPEDLVKYLKKNNLRNGIGNGITPVKPATGYNLPAYRRLPDVQYSKIDKDANVLDAYIPQDYDSAKVIIYLHGGGWVEGDKSELPKALIEELTGNRKYILVSMNYRLAGNGKNLFPAQIEDIRNALAFLSHNAKKYHYEGNEFALIGGSAGAHLAMLYAYGYDSAKKIKTVIDFFGPTDLSDKAVRSGNKYVDDKVTNLLGTNDAQSQLCLDASPYNRLSKETAVPTILFHGGQDSIIHFGQSEKLYQKLQSLNIPAQYEFYQHEGHGFGTEATVDALTKTLKWLEKYYPPGK